MAYSQEKRDEVRGYYIYERHPLEVCADKAGIPYNTVRIWKQKAKKKGDDWDRARAAARMASGHLGDITFQVIEDFALLFQNTVKEITDGNYDGLKKAEALSRLSDAYTKTMKAAAGGDPKIARLSVALEVIEELAKFIKENYPADLQRFVAILEPFAVRANEVFG